MEPIRRDNLTMADAVQGYLADGLPLEEAQEKAEHLVVEMQRFDWTAYKREYRNHIKAIRKILFYRSPRAFYRHGWKLPEDLKERFK